MGKNLNAELDRAQQRVRALKQRQREQQKREDTALGKRLRVAAGKDRETLVAEVKKVIAEMYPEDAEVEPQESPMPTPAAPQEQPSQGSHWNQGGDHHG